jgi:hypothetical protein
MTRALVIVTVALAAASLGASAQEQATTTQGSNPVAQSSVQSTPPVQQRSNPQAEPGSTQRTATSNPNQGIQNPNPADEDSPNRAQLPQTSTILPLLGLIGLGSLLAGLFARR